MTDIERVYSDADMTRTILAGVDHASLPHDYLTSDMARDRMREIERLEADNERLRESVRRLMAICECEIGRSETRRRMEAFDD